MMPPITKNRCEYLRNLSKQRFDRCRGTWLECGRWALPHRIKWMLSQMEGERNNAHIVDATHILALRSFVAGFLEGNTSASRPWFRFGVSNEDIQDQPDVHFWLDRFTKRCSEVLSNSNFYNAAGAFYYDYGTFNTGAHYIDQLRDRLFFHTMMPGSYYVLNNGYNEPVTLVREFTLTVKALVETYGKKNKHGRMDWSNITGNVKKMYEDGNYTTVISVVHVVCQNDDYDPSQAIKGKNQPWISVTYELGGPGGVNYQYAQEFSDSVAVDDNMVDLFLNVSYSRRKPFIVGKSDSGNNFEYGEKGPTLDALGLIKSANKKAIAADQAIEQILRPALQGPANLRKSYITTAPNSYIPLDPTSIAQKGLRSVFDINPAIPMLVENVQDIRSQIGKLYYADYLMYLSQNPKTRTAEETSEVVKEQQLVIGPNLQALNTSYNVPIVEFVADYVLYDDPYMQQFPMPKALQGQFLSPEFISVFAQAQRAADLPSINQYMAMVTQVGQINPKIFDKANVDKLADIFEDRLFLPPGLNNPQAKVDAMRQAAQQAQQRQQMLEQTLPAVAGAAKDMGMQVNQNNKNPGGSQ